MKRFLNARTLAILLFVVIWAIVLPIRLADGAAIIFSNDAVQYSGLAQHLLHSGMYSIDGIVPFFAREPAYSILLAGIYAVFGIENAIAVFAVQGLLILLAALFFASELRQVTNRRTEIIFLFLFCLCAPVWHVIFLVLRESLALSAALCGTAFLLRMLRRRSWADALGAGASLGVMILSYVTFLLLPVPLIPLLLFLRVDWKHVALFLLTAACVVAPWGIRNTIHTGQPCLTGCNRSAIQWYARGVQVRDLHGLEPLRCLWSEYMSRDWTGRSDACSFNAVMHRRWPDGFKATPDDLAAGKEGQRMILDHPFNYVWVTLTDVLELHFPFVDGWGRVYNVLAALSMLIFYMGVALSLSSWKKRFIWLFLCIMIYHTAVFSLTDSTPRYLLPVIFCYGALAAVGYDRALSRISKWKK